MGREVRRKERQEREAGDGGERKSKKERERWINRDYFLRDRDFVEKRGEAEAEAGPPGRTGKTGPRFWEQRPMSLLQPPRLKQECAGLVTGSPPPGDSVSLAMQTRPEWEAVPDCVSTWLTPVMPLPTYLAGSVFWGLKKRSKVGPQSPSPAHTRV